MPRLTRTCGIATATWRDRLALRDISRGPRRCHDGGRAVLRDTWHGQHDSARLALEGSSRQSFIRWRPASPGGNPTRDHAWNFGSLPCSGQGSSPPASRRMFSAATSLSLFASFAAEQPSVPKAHVLDMLVVGQQHLRRNRRARAVLMAAEWGELTAALSDPRWSTALVHLCRG